MPFYNSRNSNFVMKFRKNRDIDLYFANIFLQFPINIDFFQGAVVSLSALQIHFDRPPPPRTLHRPPVGGSAHVGNRCFKRNQLIYNENRHILKVTFQHQHENQNT